MGTLIGFLPFFGFWFLALLVGGFIADNFIWWGWKA